MLLINVKEDHVCLHIVLPHVAFSVGKFAPLLKVLETLAISALSEALFYHLKGRGWAKNFPSCYATVKCHKSSLNEERFHNSHRFSPLPQRHFTKITYITCAFCWALDYGVTVSHTQSAATVNSDSNTTFNKLLNQDRNGSSKAGLNARQRLSNQRRKPKCKSVVLRNWSSSRSFHAAMNSQVGFHSKQKYSFWLN